MKKIVFKYIESTVFDYYDTKERIKLKQEEILNPFNEFPDDNVGAGSNSVMTISDNTANTASILVEEKELKRMRELIWAIDKVYNETLSEKQKLIKLYYWERPGELTWEGVAKAINIGRRTAIRWREQFIYGVAEELGEK